MSSAELKSKINKSINTMDTEELKQAWLILKEISAQKDITIVPVQKKKLEQKINKGIQQLNNGEGTNFKVFVESLKTKYASR